MAALVGGGTRPRPGEVALAHHGVLFLDEFPEFPPHVLDALRQPIESGETTIARANHRVRYPSRFQLVAAMNPCRCGQASGQGGGCRFGSRCEESYKARISGPLWDRLDIQISMAPVRAVELALPAPCEGSAAVAGRVYAARAIQARRYSACGLDGSTLNARCPAPLLDAEAKLDGNALALLERAANLCGLSARGYYKTIRLARTIADLDESSSISGLHIGEALSLRGERMGMQMAA
jgi:magnesium chelatase family protein